MKTSRIISLIILLSLSHSMRAQSGFVDKSTDLLCLAPSATALVKAVADKDRESIVQLGLSTATGIAVSYGLNAIIAKDRPEMPSDAHWSDHHAFPSTHTMAAFDGSTYLMRRYGWKWGVPAYAVSTYVAWGRMHTGNHDIWDVLGGAAVGAGAALIFTRPIMRDKDITIAPASFGEHGRGLYFALSF